MSKNTILGYKKGLKPKNIFSDFENMYFQLSNALSIVFILCLDTKIHNIEIRVSRRPPQRRLKKKFSYVDQNVDHLKDHEKMYIFRIYNFLIGCIFFFIFDIESWGVQYPGIVPPNSD